MDDERRLRTELADRSHSIAREVRRHRKNILVPALVIQPHRAVPFDDITPDPADFRNAAVAQWEHVRSIRRAGR